MVREVGVKQNSQRWKYSLGYVHPVTRQILHYDVTIPPWGAIVLPCIWVGLQASHMS